ncbi:MAG TPA: hypothetical protein VFG92_09120 [Agromyces sp.]|nr:hypothetical protein [Agromyces sp.]
MKIGKTSRTATMVAAFALFGALIAPATAHATTGDDGVPSGSSTTSDTAVTTELSAPDATTPPSGSDAPPLNTATQDSEPDDAIDVEASDTDATDLVRDDATPPSGKSTPPPIVPEARDSLTDPSGAAADPDAVEDVYRGAIWASFELSRVTLVGGHTVGPVRGQLVGMRTQLSAPTEKDAYMVTGNWGEAGPLGIEANVAYQITMLGAATGYWVFPKAQVSHVSDYWPTVSCVVYQGDPAAGGTVADPSPFTCDTSSTQSYPNARVTFTVALNVAAEAQGVIKTEGTISLEGGHYEPNVPYHVNGAPTVAVNSSTTFDVALRDGDAPIQENLAQTVFVYRIVEAGVARPFWIAGWSQNFRGSTRFSPEGVCNVYDQDPVEALSSLPTLKPANVAPYTCTKTSERFIGYRGNYEATFTVAKRQMTDVTLPLQQKALVERVCVNIENCGLSLATVTSTFGAGRPVTGVINNPTDVKVTRTVATSGSESITNSGGFEIDLTAGGKGIGWSFSTTLKVHYERSVTNTTTTTESIGTTIPPHKRGWMDGTPPMIHTEGDIIVHDGDRYFNLTNVVVDFPDGAGHWGFTPRLEDLPPTDATEVTLEGTVTTSDAAGANGVSLMGGAYALPLTVIGPVAHSSTSGAASVAPNGSTVWSTSNQVADPEASGGAMASGSFTYQIADGGMPTDYWVAGSAKTWNPGGAPSSSCVIYQDSPHSGGVAVEDAPYRCATTIAPAGDDGIVRATFTISPAEAEVTPVTPPAPDTATTSPPTSHTTATLAKSGFAIDGAPSLVAILAIISGVGLMLAVRRRRTSPPGSD